ncbi:MAG: helix-turn-helix domain-containing protein [Trueperaceae bacterium]
MRAYSLNLRRRIIKAIDEGQSLEAVAAQYEVSERTARRYLKGQALPETSAGTQQP